VRLFTGPFAQHLTTPLLAAALAGASTPPSGGLPGSRAFPAPSSGYTRA